MDIDQLGRLMLHLREFFEQCLMIGLHLTDLDILENVTLKRSYSGFVTNHMFPFTEIFSKKEYT